MGLSVWEAACAHALDVGARSYGSLKSILANNLDRTPESDQAAHDMAPSMRCSSPSAAREFICGEPFPSDKIGQPGMTEVPNRLISKKVLLRYAGTEADERRLFYVGMTRARDLLVMSCPEKANTDKVSRPAKSA